MTKAKELPSWERLNEVLAYDPTSPSGLRWKVKVNNRAPAGAAAGCLNKLTGYSQVRVDKVQYLAHRLVFAMAHPGEYLADLQIDHINGVPGDNRIENLRAATPAQNSQNARGHKSSRSGVKGVYWDKRWRRWSVKIMSNRTNFSGGGFDRVEDAAEAVKQLRLKVHGEFTNHGERHV